MHASTGRDLHDAPLRVCIDARLSDGMPGGVQQTLVGLAHGLGALDGEDEFLFLAYPDADWLRPQLRARCRLLPCARPAPRGGWRAAVRAVVPRRALDRIGTELAARRPIPVPRSDGVVEAAGADVVHLALQSGFLTEVPSIYVPHDLQHRHLPSFFSRYELAWREAFYPALCRGAARVVALSRWGKRDLVRELGLPEEKVHVIGWAPPIDAYPEPDARTLAAARARLGLPDAFAYYPAQTFPHKNHARLVEAMARLRDREGLTIPLVCSGRPGTGHVAVERRVRSLGLGAQVRFLGYVAPADVPVLYRLARLVVFPSLFEGFGMPVLEAFRCGVPVASSDATSLPEVAGDSALLFDPSSVEAMADALRRLWTDADLRRTLAARGAARAAAISWKAVAREYLALYRLVGGRALSDEDTALLRKTAA